MISIYVISSSMKLFRPLLICFCISCGSGYNTAEVIPLIMGAFAHLNKKSFFHACKLLVLLIFIFDLPLSLTHGEENKNANILLTRHKACHWHVICWAEKITISRSALKRRIYGVLKRMFSRNFNLIVKL